MSALEGHSSDVTSVSFSPDGTKAASGSSANTEAVGYVEWGVQTLRAFFMW